MSMRLALLAGFSLGVIAVLILIVTRDFGHLRVAKTFIITLLAGSCLLLNRFLESPWSELAADIYTMVPALFWLLCLQAFSVRARVLSVAGAIALYTFVAPAVARYSGISYYEFSFWHFVGWKLPSYCEYLIIFLGLWTVVNSWSDDLVESRRRLRGVVLILVGVAILLVVIPLNTQIVGIWLPYLVINISALSCTFFLLQGRTGVLFGIKTSQKEPLPAQPFIIPEQTTDMAEKTQLKADEHKLNAIMQEGFYRTEHLTLKALAQRLEMPEYKTRALINQTLGYRNFNDYINQLRIEEAAQRLLAENDTPVLNISLDIGYRTLSSFNRAFKDIKQTTPSQFRLQGQSTQSQPS